MVGYSMSVFTYFVSLLKVCELSYKEIGPNFTYPVSRGLETGLAAAKAPYLIKLHFCTFLKKNLSEKTQEFVPQVLKLVVNLSC